MSKITRAFAVDGVAPGSAPRKRQRDDYLFLGYVLAYFAIADLSLLPMLHVADTPFKPAYAALLLAAVALWLGSGGGAQSLSRPGTRLVVGSIALMAVSGLAGHAITDAMYGIGNFWQTGRQLIVFILMMTAYWIGGRFRGFRWVFLEVILWMHGATILLLSWAPDSLPWLARLWWKSAEQIDINTAANELRPKPFGDGSMVLMNVLFLGVALGMRNAGYRLIAPLVTVPLTVVVSVVLASRNQMVATALICISVAPLILRGTRGVIWLALMAMAILCGALLFDLAAVGEWSTGRFRVGISAIENLGEIFDPDVRQADSVARPLINIDTFAGRFEAGPILGTGYSIGPIPPFDYLNMHNDMFWVLATSGVVGGIALCSLVLGVCRSVGALATLPFFLPGLTNSFLMSISACLVYCFIIGLLGQQAGPPAKVTGSLSSVRNWSRRR